MYHSTRGIFINQVKYSDTSVIARIYTEEFGLQGYMIKGFRGKRSKIKPAHLQPLALLKMVVTNREKSNLHHIREMESAHIFQSIPYDMVKSSVALFMNELIGKSIVEETPNKELFRFLFDAIQLLDLTDETMSNYHITFALKLTQFTGFYPQGIYTDVNNCFDIAGGTFVRDPGLFHEHMITGSHCQKFAELLTSTLQDSSRFRMSRDEREVLLEKIIAYYQFHLPAISGFKSHLVLKEVLK